MNNLAQLLPSRAQAVLLGRIFGLLTTVLLALSGGSLQSATNVIGSADGSFESGLGGTTPSGSVELVANLGALSAIEGAQSLLISNAGDAGSTTADIDSSTLLIENFTIDPAYSTLRLNYNFLTNEPGPSFANDAFTVTLVMVTDADEEVVLASDTFDTFVAAPWTGYALQTGYRTLIADVSAVNDGVKVLSLELRVDDVGDGRRDSAVLLDDIRLVEPGTPEARVLDNYITIAPGEAFVFDGRPSSDDVGIVEYNWDFANGFTGSGPLINMTGYTEQGFFQGTLTVVDADGNTDTTTYTVVVGDINSAPVITSVPNRGGSLGVPYRYQVLATDTEVALGDTLSYALDTAPAGMAIDEVTGLITWTPPTDAGFSTDVTLVVTDSFDEMDTQSFAITMGPDVYAAMIRDDGWIYTTRSLGDGTFDSFRPHDDIGSNTRGIVVADFDGDDDFDMVAGATSNPFSNLYYYARDAGEFDVPVYLGPIGSTAESVSSYTMDMAAEDFNNDGLIDFVVQGNSAYTFLMENTGTLVTVDEAILSTDFETGTDGWTLSGNGTTVSRDNTTASSGEWSMRAVASSAGSDLYSLIDPADFILPDGSTMSFDYRIPAGTPVGLLIHVNGYNWMSLGGTANASPGPYVVSPLAVTLIDDGEWHSIDIDIYRAIRAVTSAGYSVSRFEFWSNNTASAGQEFWFDNFRITRPRMVSGFDVSTVPSSGTAGRGIDSGDVDDDGNMDVVRARYSSGYIHLHRGDGDGNLVSDGTVIADPGVDPYAVALADFDSDDVPDLLAGYGSNGDTYFYKGNGDGSFQAGVKALDTNNYASIAAYDFNNDGLMDVIASNHTSRQLLYFRGNGDATFAAATQVAALGNNTLAVAAPAGRVLGQPFAAAEQTKTEADEGEAIDFDGADSFDDGSIISYEWNFGDGTTASGVTASHAFTTEGRFTVTLTVTDDEGFTDRVGLQVVVNGDAPLAVASGPYVLPETAAILGRWHGVLDGRDSSDTEGDIKRYEWDYDDSDGIQVDALGAVVRPAYESAGVYTVTLTVYDQTEQSHSVTTTVTVAFADPPAAALAGPAVLAEADASLGRWAGWFSAAASSDDNGIASWSLDWADGASATFRPLADDFDDGNFSGWTINGGTWTAAGGELAQTNTGGAWRWAQDLTRSYYDFQLEVDFRALTSSPDGYVGIVFHNANTSASTNSYLLYSRNSWDFWSIYDWSTGTTLKQEGQGWDAGIRYHLRLVVVGDNVKLYVTPEDGVEVLALEYEAPSTHPFGGVGLLANAQDLRFDNVKVTPLDDKWTDNGVGPAKIGHIFDTAQDYDVQVTVTDHGGQSHTSQLTTIATMGAAPEADVGGPYVLNEADADYSAWNLVVDATGSSDDNAIERYTVDFGDGTSYTAGVGDGTRSSYFAVGTDLYGQDVGDGNLYRIVATEDNTVVDVVNLDTGAVIGTKTLNRLQSWNSFDPGTGVYFKVEASHPVVAYLTDSANHSAFVPSLDGTPVGREFVFHRDGNQGFFVYAYEDTIISFTNSSGTVIDSFALLAGQYRAPALTDTIYHVVSSGRVSMQTVGANGYTTVPAASGDGAGQLFQFATYGGGGIVVMAHEAATITVRDMDTDTELYTAAIAAGDFWFQNGVGQRRLRLESDALVEVWAGDMEGGTDILSLGDDISFAGGMDGTEFVLHNLRDGIVIFAPNDATEITVDGDVVGTLERDRYLRLAPTDFASGSGVHRISSDKPIVIQTLGRANTFNDLGTYLGGVSLRHWYTATGSYDLTLTVTDNVGQTSTASTTVEVMLNDPPESAFEAPAVAGEEFADGGVWTVEFDAGTSTDDFGIASYDWDFGDGSTGSGKEISHSYTVPGTYTTRLTVTDHAGQAVSLEKDLVVEFGDGPTADTGGPYVLTEADASRGVWTAVLDARGSSDDGGIFDYAWDLGTILIDDHSDGVLDEDIWVTNVATESDGFLKFSGVNSWNQGVYSGESFQRAAGVEILGQVRDDSAGSRYMMWGVFKSSPASFSYTQMPHALYFNNGVLNIYENGSSRGQVGTYSRGVLYDVRLVLKPGGGAEYYIREAGAGDWTALTSFTSVNPSDSPLRVGASHNREAWSLDNMRVALVSRDPVTEQSYTETGVTTVGLTVRDNALQSDSTTTTITVEDGEPPVSDVGGPYVAEVGSFINFNGSGSSDDYGIQTFSWKFGDTTGGPQAEGTQTADLPYVGKGPNPRHFYQATGTYTVELEVTDRTLKTDTASTTVEVIVGDAPQAGVSPVSGAAANGPPAYFDGRSSSDDFAVVEYRWDFDADIDSDGDGNPTNDINGVGATPFHTYANASSASASTLFADTYDEEGVQGLTWNTSGVTQTGGVQLLTGAGSWSNRYATSTTTYARGRISVSAELTALDSNVTMWGLKKISSSASYAQMPHAIYFNRGAIVIYENGSSRGNKGSYSEDVKYDVRIDTLPSGAVYYFREHGASEWTELYSSTVGSDAQMHVHITSAGGNMEIDNTRVEDLGPYVVTLTVVDGAGQTSSTQQTVAVADNLAPDVITVPWVAFDPLVPHETYNGKAIRLKGIVRDADPVSYQWDFGDGTQSAVTPVSNAFDLSVSHIYPAAPAGTPFTATLSVTDSVGNVGSATYLVIVKPKNLTTEINVAIDEGLWYLHQTQTRSSAEGYTTGYWVSNARASATASAIQAFEINGHLETIDHSENPYAETVMRGLRQLFRDLGTVAIAVQTYGEPDSNGNGIGIQTGVNNSGSNPIYQGGQVMDAIAGSGTPLARAITGADGIKGRTYFEILTDMADQYAWGQTEQGQGGAWRYSWNSSIDNSAAQWGAIGMLASQDIFGIPVPEWVKERNQVWLDISFTGTGFGYTTGGSTAAGTPSGMVQLIFSESDTSDNRWLASEAWIAGTWTSQYIITPGNRPYYPFYALTKAMRLAQPEPVVEFVSSGLDWFRDEELGLARTLIDDQMTDGKFPGTTWIRDQLRSAWGVIILSRTVFVQPPVAVAGKDRVWGVDRELEFDGSGSFHLDPFRSLVKYEWDFDGDGIYDSSSDQPTATHTYAKDDYNEDDLPISVIVSLRVTDNNIPSLTDIDTAEIIVAIPPHPPVADAGGPYTCTAGVPCELDGSGSFDIDPTDSITAWEWDLDGFPFEYQGANGEKPTPVFAEGVYDIGLRVWDNGVLNDIDEDEEVDENEKLSDIDFAVVTAVPNIAPKAELAGPYQVNEGSSLILDASGSSDANGDLLIYSWDLDNDGQFDDATGPMPSFDGLDDGVYTVTVRVTDRDLDDTASAEVSVLNVAPAVEAGPNQTMVEGQQFAFNGSFTDPGTADTHTVEWDFGDGSTSTDGLTPTHTYPDDGSYTVVLTVTDDDGGVGSDTLTVTVADAAPSANLVGDNSLTEGDSGSYDATGSTSSPDDIVLYEWDWNYDGSFNPSGDSGSTATHVYPQDGNYTVAVRVTDDDGSTDIATLAVVVADTEPTAKVTGTDTMVEGDTGNYDASESSVPVGSIVSYQWDWDYSGTFAPSGDAGALQSHKYPEDGSYLVAVRVTDDDGSTAIATQAVTVSNATPVVAAGSDQSGLPGTLISLAPATFADAGVLDTHTAQINWGDGDSEAGGLTQGEGSGSVAGSHSYAGSGTYTVTVAVTDDEGATGTDSFQVSISASPNLVPQVTVGDDATIDEGGTFSGSGSFTDTDDSAWTATVDYGDGSAVQPLPVTGMAFVLEHDYAEDGEYIVTVIVNDGSGDGTDQLQVTVNNLAPVVEAGADQGGVTLGANVDLDPATFTDAGIEDTHTAVVNWGDGSGGQVATVDQSAGGGSVQSSHSYSSSGSFTVTVTVTDDEGASGDDTFEVIVVDIPNGPPVVNPGGDVTINEGEGFTGVGSFSDDEADNWTATVDYGAGDGTETLPLNGKTFALANDYPQDGEYTVTVAVNDGVNPASSATLKVTVRNLAPVVEAGADQIGIEIGAGVSLDPATFTDAGVDDVHTATVDWGDGNGPQAVSVNQGEGNGSVAASASYTSDGVYTVTVTVTDDEGASGSDTFSVTVDEAGVLACDLDTDGDVDRSDIGIISAARNMPADPPGADPRDIDGNGVINLNDARQCVVQCTYARCAAQ
ncbi:PKD domain-containing protein [Candidatus Litorirhabdus singularis]|nr:PKD domain-containing protein [Candidatus Litorirhabdus singularis]